VTRCAVKIRPLPLAPIAFEFVTTGSQLSRARDSSRVNCIPEEELGDTIMIYIEEDAKADDVDAQKQFYKKCSMYSWSGAVDCTCLFHSSASICTMSPRHSITLHNIVLKFRRSEPAGCVTPSKLVWQFRRLWAA
jgi:hypothetical protein